MLAPDAEQLRAWLEAWTERQRAIKDQIANLRRSRDQLAKAREFLSVQAPWVSRREPPEEHGQPKPPEAAEDAKPAAGKKGGGPTVRTANNLKPITSSRCRSASSGERVRGDTASKEKGRLAATTFSK
jgi:hypothetical protein